MSIVPNPNADFSPAGGVYTELKPFRFWCQKVLPLVYDDSLSYYELLCKVVDYLNKTMEDVDNAVTEVTALHAAYDQLEGYVNNYFSTLDVQQEINNKLDAMAESGELSGLISPFVEDWLPGVVEEQIPGVVGEQIGGTVAQQIGATVGQQIGATVAGQISPVVADWLDDNITPTTPVVDASLTVVGAAADAKATGDAITNLKNGLYALSDPHVVTATGMGGINIAYPMNIGDSIIVKNTSTQDIEVRQRDSEGSVIATTPVVRGTTIKITSTVNSTDIRFYFNAAGTVYFENAELRIPIIEERLDNVEKKSDDNESLSEYFSKNLFASKLVYHVANLNSLNLGNPEVIADIVIDETIKAIYIKADNITNVDNLYCIGINEYDSNDNLLGQTGRLQQYLIAGTSIPLAYNSTARVVVWYNCGTNPQNLVNNLFIWATKNGVVERKPANPVFRVEKDGSGDFTSLVAAINEATKYTAASVYVGAGTWDIIDELGDNYLANVSSTQRGLYLKNRVHVICDSRSKIVANYTGDSSAVKTWLSIFNSGEYGFTLENATLEGSNIRYLIHDERDQNADAYVNKYLNCTMVFDNRNNDAWSAKQCIGGGLGQNGYVDIEGCTFKSYQGYDGTVSYHNTGASTGRSHIVLRDCYFYLYNTFRLSWYGTSTEITDAVVTNCYLGADIVHRAETASATTENTAIVSWNNIINPHT